MRQINSIPVLAILIMALILTSCGLGIGDTCLTKDEYQEQINTAAVYYVRYKAGQIEYEKAVAATGIMYHRATRAMENGCHSEEEMILVVTALKGPYDAIQATYWNAQPGQINAFIDRAFNAANDLQTKFNWDQR